MAIDKSKMIISRKGNVITVSGPQGCGKSTYIDNEIEKAWRAGFTGIRIEEYSDAGLRQAQKEYDFIYIEKGEVDHVR